MKNVISIFLFLCSFCSFAQTNKTIELHFDISDFVVKPSEKAHDILVSSKADYLYIYKSDTLLPALPFRIVNVLIKDNQEYIELKTHRKDKLLCHNISLSANLNDHPVREYGKKTSKIAADSQTEYPIESVEFTGTHLMDGYKYLSFIVSPFKYDSRTKNLYYSSDITFTISLKSDQKHLNSSQKKYEVRICLIILIRMYTMEMSY